MGRQSRMVLGIAGAALLALLAVFAVELADSQSKARQDVKDRFRDRAKVSASLTESLFGSAGTSGRAENARRYGAARVSPRTLTEQAKQSRNLYALVLSDEGRVLATSSGTPATVTRSVRAKPAYVRQALAGRPFALSGVQRAGLAAPALGYAQPFPTRFGRRILVTGLSAQLIYEFLGGYLKQVPNVKGGQAYVLDSRGGVVASPQAGRPPGEVIRDEGLLAAMADGSRGSFGDDNYFASDTVQGAPWRVVLTGSQDELFASVNGARKWVPWILFAAFGIAAVLALVLLRRVLRSAAKLSTVNSELAVANTTLERRAGELTRSNESLERFASIASHDLQEPLRKVQTFAEQLKRTEEERLSDKGRDYLERMNDAARRMQALIDGLLAFSRITTHPRPAEKVDLTDLAREVVADLDVVVRESGATVEVGSLPTITADPLRMQQLIQNLVSNGIKFRREGVAPVVRIDGQVRGSAAEITVTDNGIGFEPRHAARIFRVFERLHGHTEYPGTGIGLALCRRIVERHGGTITAESTLGEGSTFTVTLPLRQSDEPPNASSNGHTNAEAGVPLVHA